MPGARIAAHCSAPDGTRRRGPGGYLLLNQVTVTTGFWSRLAAFGNRPALVTADGIRSWRELDRVVAPVVVGAEEGVAMRHELRADPGSFDGDFGEITPPRKAAFFTKWAAPTRGSTRPMASSTKG